MGAGRFPRSRTINYFSKHSTVRIVTDEDDDISTGPGIRHVWLPAR